MYMKILLKLKTFINFAIHLLHRRHSKNLLIRDLNEYEKVITPYLREKRERKRSSLTIFDFKQTIALALQLIQH